jgi:hypothetical protein
MANSPYLTDQAVLGASPEVVGLERQRKLADLLTSQAFQSPQGQMISGHYVKPATTQQIQPLLSALLGSTLNQSLDEKQTKLAAALRGEQTKAVEDYMAAMQGQNVALPEQQGPMPTGGNIPIQVQNTGPNYGAAFKAATRPSAPASLQTMGYDLLKPITTKEGETISMRNFGPGGGTTELASGGEKQTDMMRNYNLARQQGFKGSLIDYELALKRAGASNVSVNTGQHGFDNTLKLRSDFRSEPTYKAYQEVDSAYRQVREGAKMQSPAGDLAAATKVMKILDPGSVVRESELGMAIAATGLADRVGNYATMVIQGTKLTPSQRKDFTDLSEKLYNAAANQYNSKRAEYETIANRNQLNAEDVAGAPAKIAMPKNTNIRSMADQILQGK